MTATAKAKPTPGPVWADEDVVYTTIPGGSYV